MPPDNMPTFRNGLLLNATSVGASDSSLFGSSPLGDKSSHDGLGLVCHAKGVDRNSISQHGQRSRIRL